VNYAPPPHPAIRIAKHLFRWAVLLLLLIVLLFGCGQLALWNPFPQVLADTRSRMAADYSPWPFVRIAAVDPSIIEEIQRDLQAEGEAVPALPQLGAAVEIWATAAATATPAVAGTATLPPGTQAAQTGTSPASTPTDIPAGTATGTQASGSSTATSTIVPSFTPTVQVTTLTPTHTGTATRTPSPTPTRTLTRPATHTRTVTPTRTLTPTRTTTGTQPTPTRTRTPTRTAPPPALTATRTRTPTITQTASASPTATFTLVPTDTPTTPPTATFTLVPTSTPTVTITFTPTPTVTLTPTVTPTVTPTDTETPTVTPTDTETPTVTLTHTPTTPATHTPTVTATASPPDGGPDVGGPDCQIYELNGGNSIIVDLGSPALVTGHAGFDLVYYESQSGGGILMDWVIIFVCEDAACATEYEVFNWGDGGPDSNTNVGGAGYSAPEDDNEAIPAAALWTGGSLQTGIAIDIDPLVPAPRTFQYIRIFAPSGGDFDPAQIDGVEVLP
jgi:hypothetical protein